MKALSIRQPWAWLIVNGYKDVENRNWKTSFRGKIFIHASRATDGEMENMLKQFSVHLNDPTGFTQPKDRPDLIEMAQRFQKHMDEGDPSLQTGGIVGMATIKDCVTKSDSPWFQGKFGLVLTDVVRLPFLPLKGQLSLFTVPDAIVRTYGL